MFFIAGMGGIGSFVVAFVLLVEHVGRKVHTIFLKFQSYFSLISKYLTKAGLQSYASKFDFLFPVHNPSGDRHRDSIRSW